MNVMITAPHAGCGNDNPTTRTCDRAAFAAASALKNEFEAKGVKVAWHPNTSVLREKVDMNRRQGRETDYRKGIRAKLQEWQGKGSSVYVFDMHSFPNLDENHNTHPIYFLPHERKFSQAVELARYIDSHTPLTTGVYLGSVENDITLEALEIVPEAKTFLIEHWELLSPVHFQQSAVAIVQWTLEAKRN